MAEKKYVERTALQENIKSFAGILTDDGFMVDLQAVLNAIDFADAADVAPVVHGRWIEKPNPWGQDGSHSYDCSICGERTCVVGHKLRYCPNCGAKMNQEQSPST